jgi:HPt (histidine-containing phosphotransfer) domain-containing protein
MILYNHNKEFLGIDKQDLEALHVQNLAQLLQEANDFADLFVKTPGHIHNFQHIHWIDYIIGSDAKNENRVIIKVQGRSYKAVLQVETLYLTDAPQKPAYKVLLQNLRPLVQGEEDELASDINNHSVVAPPSPPPKTEEPPVTPPTSLNEEKQEETPQEDVALDLLEDVFTQESKETQTQQTQPEVEEELSIDIPIESVKAEEEHFIEIEEDDPFADYVYDPQVVSEELGLPTDLVEEFIQDFIAQAHEFKPSLYESFETGNIETLRELSHKLKGVAANLRIEDAFEALIVVNKSDDMAEVKHSLDKFYNVILKKLAGEEVVKVKKQVPPPSETPVEAIELDAPVKTTINVDDVVEISLDDDTIDLHVDEVAPIKVDNEQDDAEKIDLVLDAPEAVEQNDEKIDLEIDAIEPIEFDAPQEETPEEQKVSLEEKVSFDDEKIDLVLEDEVAPVSLNEEALPEVEEIDEKIDLVLDEVEQNNEIAQEVDTKTQEDFILAINEQNAALEMGIDVAIYKELLDDYKQDALEALSQIKEQILSGNEDAIKKLAIRLKGMSENMHIPKIPQLCEELINAQNEQRTAVLQNIEKYIDSMNRK